ncbi:Hypothetical_protein [Hexamita inflata]|uniref:Hypothetical_protein n=1 Tax=Hexamita inflata TaxID=28002 RepID=A0AA86PSS0_9EUKA|nr:Hypothetical protein HINF_LOCUS28495 [Hexamita inflata]
MSGNQQIVSQFQKRYLQQNKTYIQKDPTKLQLSEIQNKFAKIREQLTDKEDNKIYQPPKPKTKRPSPFFKPDVYRKFVRIEINLRKMENEIQKQLDSQQNAKNDNITLKQQLSQIMAEAQKIFSAIQADFKAIPAEEFDYAPYSILLQDISKYQPTASLVLEDVKQNARFQLKQYIDYNQSLIELWTEVRFIVIPYIKSINQLEQFALKQIESSESVHLIRSIQREMDEFRRQLNIPLIADPDKIKKYAQSFIDESKQMIEEIFETFESQIENGNEEELTKVQELVETQQYFEEHVIGLQSEAQVQQLFGALQERVEEVKQMFKK